LVWTKSAIADTLRLLVSPGRKQTVSIYKELVFGRDCIGENFLESFIHLKEKWNKKIHTRTDVHLTGSEKVLPASSNAKV
jgi:hypothetical protein